MRFRFPKTLCVLLLLLASFASTSKADTNNDFQQWSLIFVNHHINDKWSASMQVENRLRDNASERDKQVYKPAGYYQFTDTLQLGVGYKYVRKYNAADEQDPWQELFYRPVSTSAFDWVHQFRLEQRTGDSIDGVVPRLRYLLHVSHPLGDSKEYYWAAQEALRFNAASKDTGPVDGFEQSRLYFGVGKRVSHKLKVEVGYLWNYQRIRDANNLSNHVLRLQFLVDTQGLFPFFIAD
ncbi:MAG: DUF2490 domain-containing protein [Halioglobus sp.]